MGDPLETYELQSRASRLSPGEGPVVLFRQCTVGIRDFVVLSVKIPFLLARPGQFPAQLPVHRLEHIHGSLQSPRQFTSTLVSGTGGFPNGLDNPLQVLCLSGIAVQQTAESLSVEQALLCLAAPMPENLVRGEGQPGRRATGFPGLTDALRF